MNWENILVSFISGGVAVAIFNYFLYKNTETAKSHKIGMESIEKVVKLLQDQVDRQSRVLSTTKNELRKVEYRVSALERENRNFRDIILQLWKVVVDAGLCVGDALEAAVVEVLDGEIGFGSSEDEG